MTKKSNNGEIKKNVRIKFVAYPICKMHRIFKTFTGRISLFNLQGANLWFVKPRCHWMSLSKILKASIKKTLMS